MKKILILEPHPYHYEVIYGIAKYFLDLGYKVDVLVQESFDRDDIWCRVNDKITILKYKMKDVREILNDKKICQYDYLFFSSMEFFHNNKKERFLDYLGFQPKTKYGILGIYHNKNMISEKDQVLLEEGRIFSLSPFEYNGVKINMLCICSTGEVCVNEQCNSQKKILLIGLSNRRMLLENAVEQLISENQMKCEIKVIGNIKWQKDLMKRSISNIIVSLCKKAKLKTPYEKCTRRSWKKISYLGVLNNKKMFEEIENSDFIGIILDPEDWQSKPFLNGKSSGSKQLALAFSKPCIINEQFAESHGFDENNSILYKENDIKGALIQAMNITQNEYRNKVRNMTKLRNDLYVESMNHLVEVLRKIER